MVKSITTVVENKKIVIPSAEGIRRAILVKALLVQSYINKSDEEISIYKLVDYLQLLFKSVVSFAFFDEEGKVVFYSIKSPRYQEDFEKQVNTDGIESSTKIANTNFYISVYKIVPGKEKKSFFLLKNVKTKMAKDEFNSFIFLWDSITPCKDINRHQELGLNQFINEILTKACEPQTIHSIRKKKPADGYKDFFDVQEKKIKSILNNMYGNLQGKAIIERNGLGVPAILFFFKPYRYNASRFNNTYQYPLQIILCKKQIDDINIVFNSIKQNNDNLDSDNFNFKINNKTIKNSVYKERNISKIFWDTLNSEKGVEKLISVLEEPFTDARSFVDDVFYSSLSHWVSPFSSKSSFGKDRIGKNSDGKDKLRLAIVFYFFSCVTAKNNTETLYVKASPIRVGGSPYLIAACPMAYLGKPRKDLIFDIAYYLESSILGSMAIEFRKRIKKQYLSDVSDIFYDAFKTAFLNMKNKPIIINNILRKINDKYYQLCRIYPYQNIVCSLRFFQVKDQKKIEESCTPIKTYSQCLGGQRYLEINAQKPNPFFSKMLEKNFNHVDKIRKEIERAFQNVIQYIYIKQDALKNSKIGEKK